MPDKKQRFDLAWIAGGVIAVLVSAWLFPRVFPLYPQGWNTSKEEAETIAIERLTDLGELPESPYFITRVNAWSSLEPRLREALDAGVEAQRIRESPLGRELMGWEIVIYPREARSVDWSYRVSVNTLGDVTELRKRVPAEEERGALDETRARQRAAAFLRTQGIDLAEYGDPEVRSQQLQRRTDTQLRYPAKEQLVADEIDHGIEVSFAGDELEGFSYYVEDPKRAELQSTLQPIILMQQAWIFLALVLLAVVAIPFVKRYHAGEVGVRRSVQILALIVVCGVIVMAFCARSLAAGFNIGVLTKPQTTAILTFQFLALYFVPLGLMAFLSWAVGESLCRERHGYRLAAFDALFQGEWTNATFARAVLRGVVSGLGLVAVLLVFLQFLSRFGVWASTALTFSDWWRDTSLLSVPMIALAIASVLYQGLFGRLFLASWLERRTNRWIAGVLTALIGALVFFPAVVAFPVKWSLLVWIVGPALYVYLFFRFGLLTSMMAQLTAMIFAEAGSVLGVADPKMQLQAIIALFVVAIPLIVSARYLWSGKTFVYRYEDIPPHVRRIAERERQKVELETARRIQASILPELPPELNGVEITHSYLPATEVGGDFYDVLALDDGRLALAVGDVAGHGVSSGLVMSMTKSALAVQVSFNPEVEAVFNTLNRMVYQSARKRLLATLCYAVLDPTERRLEFASAGHLFPYRVSSGGEVYALESVSYPLGVREGIEIRERAANLESGDYLFLFSDGVVEARREGSDDLYGFERLERSLRRHAGGSVQQLKQGVLDDLEEFTGFGPREDDLTLLVLRLPQ